MELLFVAIATIGLAWILSIPAPEDKDFANKRIVTELPSTHN